jgi:hypothetical protein
MEDDPLAQYRRKPLERKEPEKQEAVGYLAFAGKDRVDRLRIRRANAPTRAPGYNVLLDVVYDGEFGTNFVLVYTYMMVLVRGRNLQGLVLALESCTADFIQEYDADRWEKPADESAPFIDSIEVAVKTSAEAVSDSEKVKVTRH